MHIYIKNKLLRYKDYKVKCSIGKRGIKYKKREGDLITPKGTFKVKGIYYRKDRITYLPTKLSKKVIKKNMGWCDDPKSKKYNMLITYPFSFGSERLYRNDNIYDVIVVLNYNMDPITKNKGSAIFIHIAKKNFTSTEGCVGIKKKDMKKIVRTIDKKTKVEIS